MSAGKGDSPRPVDGAAFRSRYDKIRWKREPEEAEPKRLAKLEAARKALAETNEEEEGQYP